MLLLDTAESRSTAAAAEHNKQKQPELHVKHLKNNNNNHKHWPMLGLATTALMYIQQPYESDSDVVKPNGRPAVSIAGHVLHDVQHSPGTENNHIAVANISNAVWGTPHRHSGTDDDGAESQEKQVLFRFILWQRQRQRQQKLLPRLNENKIVSLLLILINSFILQCN